MEVTSLHPTHFDPLGDVVPENIVNFQANSEDELLLLSGLRHYLLPWLLLILLLPVGLVL